MWIDHLKKNDQNMSKHFDPRLIVMYRSQEIVEFIDDECGDNLDTPRLRAEMFKAAVYSKDIDGIQRAIDRGGVDINKLVGCDDLAPLDILVDIPRSIDQEAERQLQISARTVEVLLKNGANPNGCTHTIQQYSPFEYAVGIGNVAAAMVLLEHGATRSRDT
ncbi:hypothetical protein N7517_006085 [Penicillium concentricum]|uniref:Uncharacterized protein n=1 Tax=Penicillium concentricum TaxID=293559 RepID=A0A9W9VB02_9EURO|nr:uncharacterized protein N7517_006085 [Penicillium concentricum]KAJ5374079.1 hypothetical protein N7517_006085 [Penicillium concentricum]